jgi:transposase
MAPMAQMALTEPMAQTALTDHRALLVAMALTGRQAQLGPQAQPEWQALMARMAAAH